MRLPSRYITTNKVWGARGRRPRNAGHPRRATCWHLLARALAASYTTMETAPEIASLAIRTCGGLSMLKEFRLEQYYRDARCGSLMLPWSAEVCLHRLGRHGIFPDDAE